MEYLYSSVPTKYIKSIIKKNLIKTSSAGDFTGEFFLLVK